MSKYCPLIDGPVVYLECMECDDKYCLGANKKVAVKKIKKIVKATNDDIKNELKKAKTKLNNISGPILDMKYSGIIKAKDIPIPNYDPIQFVPIHNHTDYSVKDSVMSIDEFIEVLKENGMPGGSITDHGNMSSSLKFYKAMKANGLKPIIGNEVYTDDNIDKKIEASLDRSKRKKDEESVESGYLNDDYGHLVLMAPTEEAYHELLLTNAKGFRDGFYKRPRVTHEYILNEVSKHQIATTACLASKFNNYIRCNNDDAARQLLDDYKSAFGDRFYVELHFNELEIQRYCTNKLLKFAKEMNIPWIIGLDAHYARKGQEQYHDYLKMIHYGGTISKPSKFLYSTRELYVKNSNEIFHANKKWEYGIDEKDIRDGLNRTIEIYDRTNFEMDLGHLKFPKYNDDKDFDAINILKKKCIAGFHRRKKQGLIPSDQEKVYIDRFNYEFPVVVKKGYADYFLIVSEFTDYCRKTDLFRGPGRGSAAGAVLSWLLGITKVDPIRYGLFFERFLNEERLDPPDIDLDFDSERRYEIEELLINKYGKERVAHIMSFGTFAAKGIMRDMSKIFELPFIEVDKLCKQFNDDESIQENIDRLSNSEKSGKDTAKFVNGFLEEYGDFIEACKFFEGKVRHYSLHASGVVVTPDTMEKFAPLNRASGQIVTGLQEGGDIREISDIGLLKFDILGLNNCTILNKALKSIKRRKNIDIDLDAIDLEDDNLLERFRQGHTTGIFQFESSGITKFITDLQPEKFEDMSLVNAAYRPGTLKAGGVDKILENRHKEDIDYMHPLIEEVLGPTYNTLVYQEQQMSLMNKVGGFTMVEADKSRKTIKLINKASTASPEKLKQFYDMVDKFKEGAHQKTGLPYEKLQNLVDAMASAADYSFNKSHSCSYAILAVQNMYLKHYYSADYAAALLSCTKNEEKKGKKGHKTGENKIEKCIKMAINELNLTVLQPNVNYSGFGWKAIDDKTIAPSLDFIKGVGDVPAQEIEKFKPFDSVEDFFSRDFSWRYVNKRVMEGIIQTGLFDELYSNRKVLLEAYTLWNANKNKIGNKNIEDRKEYFKKYLEKAEENIGDVDFTFEEKLSIEFEKFGFYFSDHPLNQFAKKLDQSVYKKVGQLAKGKTWKKGTIYGIVTKAYPYKISKGYMCFVDIIDQDDITASITVWPEIYKSYKEELQVGKMIAIKVKPGKDKNDNPCFYVDESDSRKKIILLEKLVK